MKTRLNLSVACEWIIAKMVQFTTEQVIFVVESKVSGKVSCSSMHNRRHPEQFVKCNEGTSNGKKGKSKANMEAIRQRLAGHPAGASTRRKVGGLVHVMLLEIRSAYCIISFREIILGECSLRDG